MSTFKLVLKNKAIMKKIGFTLFALLVYRLAILIPIPMINVSSSIFETDLLGFLNAFTGGALASMSIVALGVGPYITASIISEVLKMDIVPFLKEWSEQGEVGRKKINNFNKYLAIFLAFVQALALTYGISFFDIGVEATPLVFVYLAVVMTAGTSFLIWLGDKITTKGIGNGVSLIIAAGIISGFPQMFSDLYSQFIANGEAIPDYIIFGAILLLLFVIVCGVTYMQSVTRKIPIQYANRSNSGLGKNDSNIPIRFNSAGVIPVIFAITFLSLPLTIISFSGVENTLTRWLIQIFDSNEPIGFTLYLILIFVFSFYYSFVTVDPDKITTNLQKQNAFIPSIRPGEETEIYISKILFKVTMLGAFYLSILAALPIVTTFFFDLPSSVQVGGTSIIIVVGVAIETFRQITTEAKKVEYKGFIK